MYIHYDIIMGMARKTKQKEEMTMKSYEIKYEVNGRADVMTVHAMSFNSAIEQFEACSAKMQEYCTRDAITSIIVL